jgi:hypothetical protein
MSGTKGFVPTDEMDSDPRTTGLRLELYPPLNLPVPVARRPQLDQIIPLTKKLSERIPPEVWDLTVDHFWSDVRMLETCNLVCKSWYPRAHFHLFSTILVGNERARQFLSLLVKYPERGKAIRFVNLVMHSPMSPELVKLVVLLASCPQIGGLRIFGLLWNKIDSRVKASLINGFENVTTLDMQGGSFDVHWMEAAEVISSFPKLETLIIGGIPSTTLVKSSLLPPPNLRVVNVVSPWAMMDRCYHNALNWLAESKVAFPLESITISDFSLENLGSISALLRAAGPALKELSLSWKGAIASSPGTSSTSTFTAFN